MKISNDSVVGYGAKLGTGKECKLSVTAIDQSKSAIFLGIMYIELITALSSPQSLALSPAVH